MKQRPAHIQVSLLNDHPLIFSHVRQDSKAEWAISLLIDAAGWGIWLYLWKVLITSVAWYFGLNLAYQAWGNHSGLNQFLSFVDQVALYGLVLCLVLWAWALQDIWRFRTDVRRIGVRYPSLEEDCHWTKIGPQDLEKARTEKILLCIHDATGELITALPQK
jgi:poly-beta-1,6-N-acetyl-D-glucosamine biosynthesis protein PgaD